MSKTLIDKIVKQMPIGLPDKFFSDLQKEYHKNNLQGYMSMKEYCLSENISRGTAYSRIKAGEVIVKKFRNLTYLKNKKPL